MLQKKNHNNRTPIQPCRRLDSCWDETRTTKLTPRSALYPDGGVPSRLRLADSGVALHLSRARHAERAEVALNHNNTYRGRLGQV